MNKLAMLTLAAALAVPVAFAQTNDAQLQASVRKALSSSSFKEVQVSVQNGIVTLSGSVPLFANKLTAEQKVRHVKGIGAVRDQIQVAGATVPDAQLQQKIQKAIAYDLWGNVPVQFQAVAVQVHDGVVTLNGFTAGPIAASDTVAVVANTKGVKDIVDNIQVDPLSPMDNQLRVAVFRKVYSNPMLSQYVMDPEKPIRIQVMNGHVTLYGTVDSEAQKNVAGIQANSVAGVFSVTNDLQVAGQPSEHAQK